MERLFRSSAEALVVCWIGRTRPRQPGAEPYNVYRFNAKRFDPASDSYDMGFRDYSPGLNRFLTRDNYNGALADLNLATSPSTMNRYAYAGGNPSPAPHLTIT